VVEGGAEPYAAANNLQALASSAVEDTGGGGEHNNMQPFLTLNFCIALTGLFPSRS
jgi:microcystin-dependent protein